MDIETLLVKTIKVAFLPPGLNIAMILLGLLLIKQFYTTGKLLLISGFTLLVILSLPITAEGLNLILEREPPLTLENLKKSDAKAIVVLGAGRYINAIEFENRVDSISSTALTRLTYAAHLHRASQLPLLISGGSPLGRMQSEASIMQTTLKEDFQLKAKWLDSNSSNTWNNAKFSSDILKTNKITNIILVTHADHMLRATMAFEHFGLKVTPAPLGFNARNNKEGSYTLLDFLPTSGALRSCSSAMHEFIGYLWYLIRYKGVI